MKPIKLTEEHKSKLLEMCNKLFPEYKEIVLTQQKTLNFGFKHHGSHTSIIANMSIHWFEFCLYYLVDKIFDDTKEESYMTNKDFYMGGLVYRNHTHNPIDILYKQFKKLK